MDQILRDAAKSEAANDERRAISNVADRLIRGCDHFVDHEREDIKERTKVRAVSGKWSAVRETSWSYDSGR
jgi:hypothetical protein